jgi:hypothetical protein
MAFFLALEGYSPYLHLGERSRDMTISAILHEAPPSLTHRGRLADVILSMLNRDPSQRADAEELDETLQSILDEPKMRAPVTVASSHRTQPSRFPAPPPAEALSLDPPRK